MYPKGISISALPRYLTLVVVVISVLLLTVLYNVLNCEFLKKINSHIGISQNSLSTNRPSFTAANQIVTVTRVTSERVV